MTKVLLIKNVPATNFMFANGRGTIDDDSFFFSVGLSPSDICVGLLLPELLILSDVYSSLLE